MFAFLLEKSFACLHDTEFCFCLKGMGAMWAGCFCHHLECRFMPPDYYGNVTIRRWEQKLLGTSFLSTFSAACWPSLGRHPGPDWCSDSLLFYSRYFNFFFYSGKLYKHLLRPRSDKKQRNIHVNQACRRKRALEILNPFLIV